MPPRKYRPPAIKGMKDTVGRRFLQAVVDDLREEDADFDIARGPAVVAG